MFKWIRSLVLRLVRVPHDPEPPLGAPDSVQIFRAGRNYYKLRLFRWSIGQIGAVIGIIFSLNFLYWFKAEVDQAAATRGQHASVITPSPAAKKWPIPNQSSRIYGKNLKAIAEQIPPWVVPLVGLLEFGGVLIFLLQVPVSFAAVRLEYEMHWYIVTDRSLRIRTGLFKLTESTMSFANLQQVEVKQGPLQRLLGLADVHVQSAGGGGDRDDKPDGDSLHTGIFHSVDNATEIRDLIQNRLHQFREAGLGDVEDAHHHASPSHATAYPLKFDDSVAAANEILIEARALRQLMQSRN